MVKRKEKLEPQCFLLLSFSDDPTHRRLTLSDLTLRCDRFRLWLSGVSCNVSLWTDNHTVLWALVHSPALCQREGTSVLLVALLLPYIGCTLQQWQPPQSLLSLSLPPHSHGHHLPTCVCCAQVG